MTAYKATYIECDQCGAFCMPRKPRRAALAQAAERGWDIGRGNIADLCPRCVEADRIAAAVHLDQAIAAAGSETPHQPVSADQRKKERP